MPGASPLGLNTMDSGVCFSYLQRQTASVSRMVVVSLIPCGAGDRIQGLVYIQRVFCCLLCLMSTLFWGSLNPMSN